MRVSGVIFDCDGTLLDSMGAWFAVQDEIALRSGTALTDEDLETINALTIPETGDYLHKQLKFGSSGFEVEQLINELMLDYYRTQTQVRPGALEFVEEIHKRGVICSVASSTPTSHLKVALDVAGFTPFLTAVVSVDDAGASKREPAVYDLARSLMGTDKESTWVFEDSIYALRTLKSAEYHCVGIYDNDIAGTLDELSIADITIKEFSEIDVERFISGSIR